MNKLLQASAIGVLGLGYASAHAGIVAARSSTTPGDLLLFAEVVNSGAPVAYYVGDTNVLVGGTNPASNLHSGSLIQTGGDVNLNTLLSLAGTSGNTLEWAVQGGGYDSSANSSVLTTVGNSTDLTQLQSRLNANVGSMIVGLSGTINNTLNAKVGSGSSYEGAGSTTWDTTTAVTSNGFNPQAWFNNGTYTAQTGFGTTTLYGVIAPFAGGFTVTSDGTVTLNASGLTYSNGSGPVLDSYNVQTRKLTMPALLIGSATYSNVLVTVAGILTPPSGTSPNGSVDSYDPSDGHLTVQAVTVGANTYFNAVVALTGLDSIGSVTGADTFDGTNLTIAKVQVGQTIYTDVVITVAGIVSLARGMPAEALDSYNLQSRELSIAAVQFNSAVYTNVVIRVGSIEHVGGSGPAKIPATPMWREPPKLLEGGGDIFGLNNRH